MTQNVAINLNDKRLVRQLLAGDEQAFTRFFDEFFPRVYRFAVVRLGNDTEATREVVQQVLAKALRKLSSYKGEAALFTWLCAICRNEICDWLRRQGRYRQHIVLLEDHPDFKAAAESYPMSESENPDTQFQRVELARLIQVALDQLPDKYGKILEWKYIEGYSIKEIAGRMEIGHEATQSLLARAKRAFSDVYCSLVTPSNLPSNVPGTAQT